MAEESWVVSGPQVIDVDDVRSLRVQLVAGRVDVVTHDEAGARVEVHSVDGRPLEVSLSNGELRVGYQFTLTGWEGWLDKFRNFRDRDRADLSIAVPRDLPAKVGTVSAEGLVAGIRGPVSVSTVSGSLVVDGTRGVLSANTVSGEVVVRDHDGDLSMNSVSGELAASGALTRVDANTVSGELALDITSGHSSIEASTVSGDVTVRLPEGEGVHVVANALSGRLVVDGRGPWWPHPGPQGRPAHRRRPQLGHGEHRVRPRHPVARCSRHPGHPRAPGRAGPAAGRAGHPAAPGWPRHPRDALTMPPVFAHGQLRLYLLALLEQRPMHGYEVITALSDRFGGTYRPSAGTIYPRLAQLEEDGLVRRTDVERRSTYELTDAGRAELEARRGELAALEQGIAETVRDRAARVRDDVRGTMKGLRAELAAAAQEARASAPQHTGSTRDGRSSSHVRFTEADALVRRFRDEVRAELRRADTAGRLEDLTVETLRTVLDSALSAVRQTVR